MTPSLGNRFSQHSFSQVPTANTPRSKFDRSFASKDTMDFDILTPMFIDEVLPGDTINLNVKTFMRLATQAVPMMENMYIDFYFFFCPNRLVWDNFQKQMGEQDSPGDSIDFLTPILNINSASVAFTVGSIFDHFGLPTDVGNLNNWHVNALPFRMYNLIHNTWFRDQNLQNPALVSKGNGPDSPGGYALLHVAKKHDYFTSALPFLQKGNPVTIPVTGTAPVTSTGIAPEFVPTSGPAFADGAFTFRSAGPSYGPQSSGTATNGSEVAFTDVTGLETSFTDNVIMTINAFRQAMQLQSFLEQDARGGTRFTEIIKSHFNVFTGDARVQRPEFLSGATINISQYPVAQTSESATSPQANLAAFSTAAEFGNKIGFSKSFVEHGFVLGFARARADITYQQGLHKMWSRRTRYDYFWPKFQELGEQAILNQEIYCQDSADNALVFGYQERYAEYRYRPSEIKGQFRSTYAESLDVWHLAEEFAELPTLSDEFIRSNTPIERALVVAEGYPALLCDYWFDYKHVRAMVTYPVPASLGRF